MADNPEKFAPHSKEAEEAVLGSVLFDPSLLVILIGILTESDFFFVKHAWVWAALVTLHRRKFSIDNLTLSEELKAHGQLEGIGGEVFLLYLTNNTPTHIHAQTYAEIVVRAATRRRLLAAASDIAQAALQEDVEIGDVIAAADQALMKATAIKGRRSPSLVKDLSEQMYNRVEHLSENPDTTEFISTGFQQVDTLLSGGFYKGDLVYIAARPGVGKTSFMLNVAIAAARPKPGVKRCRVLVLSMEMAKERLMERLYGSIAAVDTTHLKTGKLSAEEWQRYTNAIPLVESLPIFIDDTPALSMADANGKIAELARHGGIDLVCVDYLGLMQATGKVENQNLKLSQISKAWKEVARSYNIPVLLAAQLNRDVEKRQDRRPQMSDFRDSGSPEEDGDVVIMLHREEMYDPDTERPGQADILVRKNRNGPMGERVLLYQKEFTRFVQAHKVEVDLKL